ncbi:MAG: TIGR03620 family F420-dependent LLM class oxidoreductase [Acidimicrobiales bacterium]
MDLGRVGVWWSGSWRVADEASFDVAAELEELGYSALWSSGGFQPGLSPHFERLLGATTRAMVCSGIVSIWSTAPHAMAQAVADLELRHPNRFVLGLGASHAAIVENYTRPYRHMVDYLDALDAAGPPVARERRVVAALGPRMLDLAAERAAGAHPYFVPVEHTVRARQLLGGGALLAPEVSVVLEEDASTARMVAWGGADDIASRIRQHLEAGANHVCVQVIAPLESFPLAAYRQLAPALMEL